MADNDYIEGESVVTDDEIMDFIGDSKLPSYHTILEVWRTILANAEEEKAHKVTAGFSNKIISSYVGIEFPDMRAYQDTYFDKVIELAGLVDMEIESDEHCLSYTTPEEDVAENSHHYKNIILQWQLCLVQWELDWDCGNDNAAIELAAISEVHKMFFGPTGITGYLDNIKFQFEDSDQEEMAEAINELKASA